MGVKICALTGSRADYGPLKRTLIRLRDNNQVELDLLVTGTHLSAAFGRTVDEIAEDGFAERTEIPIPIDEGGRGDVARATGIAIERFSEHFCTVCPDLLLVLGDRYEALAAAIAAHLNLIPIAHISGGDVTEGAVDDSIRHSITKMSQIHFPGCEASARRIVQMGEQPDCVFNVGEPGVENCLKTDLMSQAELAESTGFDAFRKDYAVVTFHPETAERNSSIQHVSNLIKVMERFPNLAFIVTLANADAGGRAINDLWLAEANCHENWLVVPSLGERRYLSAVKSAQVVIGNSSSGIIEAPVLGVPSVNIGNRQKGRMLAESVVNCDTSVSGIEAALMTALSREHREVSKKALTPYGDGTTSSRIEQIIIDRLSGGQLPIERPFFSVRTNIGS